jgi:hypothetical protein
MLSSHNIANLENTRDLPVFRVKGSKPIIVIDEITEEEKKNFKKKVHMKNVVLKKYNAEAHAMYESYEPRCWVIDTPSKCVKYCLNNMLSANAYSSTTNVHDTTKNVLMIYLYESTLIISPWYGEETLDDEDSTAAAATDDDDSVHSLAGGAILR